MTYLYHTRKYLSNWIARESTDGCDIGLRDACKAMQRLNIVARRGGDASEEIYHMKNRLVEHLWYQYQHEPSTELTAELQQMRCYHCGGTGIYNDGYHQSECWDCNGGIHREHVLYLFRFEVAGEVFEWHQPEELVHFVNQDVYDEEDNLPLYESPKSGPQTALPYKTPEYALFRDYYTVYWYLVKSFSWRPPAYPLRPGVMSLRDALGQDWINATMPVRKHWNSLLDRLKLKTSRHPYNYPF